MNTNQSITRSLDIFGWSIDPVILAALSTEKPLLFVGLHGTGKSHLVQRLARALGVEHQ